RFRHEIIDVQSIPREDASFDVVTANHMLYHVPDLKKALAEMRRILKSGGKLYTATNGKNHLRELYDLQYEFDPTLNYWEGFSAAKSFELDNALPLLADYFPTVSVRRYEDELDVTEAEPLLAYMLSGPAKAVIVGEKRAALRDFLQQRLDSSGAIHITKDSGLLISTR